MQAFRPARPASTTWNLAKTALQSAGLWLVFVVLLPWAIARIGDELVLARISCAGQTIVAVGLFVFMAALNISSGAALAVHGRGTPFPLDTAREFVVRGPYRFMRNPMAVGGLGAGLAVGLHQGSWLTMLYVVVGGLLWNFVARPLEERDLLARFGAPYEAYRREVPCWRPRWRPYGGQARS